MSKIKTAYQTIEEVPEDLKDYHEVTDDGIFYNASGMKSAMVKERENSANAKKEAEELRRQIEALKNNAPQDNKPEPKSQEPKQTDPEVEELKKALAMIQEERAKEKAENETLKKQREIQKAADSTGLRPEMISNYQSQIGKDERGLYIIDIDGKPAINPNTGQRLTPMEFFTAEKQAKPWAFKDVAQGSDFTTGTGLAGLQHKTKINASEIDKLKKQRREAAISGNQRLIENIDRELLKHT